MFDPVIFELLAGLFLDRLCPISLVLGNAMHDAIFGGSALRFAACGALARHSQVYDLSHTDARR
jgi:hypothetical protein